MYCQIVAAGALHGATTYAVAKLLNKEHSPLGYAIAGAAAGYLVRFDGSAVRFPRYSAAQSS